MGVRRDYETSGRKRQSKEEIPTVKNQEVKRDLETVIKIWKTFRKLTRKTTITPPRKSSTPSLARVADQTQR